MCYYLLIIYKGKGLEKTLILSTRKFRESIFDIAVMDFNEQTGIMFNL